MNMLTRPSVQTVFGSARFTLNSLAVSDRKSMLLFGDRHFVGQVADRGLRIEAARGRQEFRA
jgi:hypothetical protein